MMAFWGRAITVTIFNIKTCQIIITLPVVPNRTENTFSCMVNGHWNYSRNEGCEKPREAVTPLCRRLTLYVWHKCHHVSPYCRSQCHTSIMRCGRTYRDLVVLYKPMQNGRSVLRLQVKKHSFFAVWNFQHKFFILPILIMCKYFNKFKQFLE